MRKENLKNIAEYQLLMIEGKIGAAKEAVKLVKDGCLLGLGSGTTVEVFIKELSIKVKEEEIEVLAVPSSYQSHILASKAGIKVVDLIQYPELDICIDGADQIDKKLNCIKGGGGALTREKVVAFASKKFIVIADESKLSNKLNHYVPVEVLPFASGYVMRRLKSANPVLRESGGKLGPVITDNGNFILDCSFGEIENPKKLEQEINSIPGVIECGIFSEVVNMAILGKDVNTVKILRR